VLSFIQVNGAEFESLFGLYASSGRSKDEGIIAVRSNFPFEKRHYTLVSDFCKDPGSTSREPLMFTPNARAYRTSAVHFSESRSSTCREPYCESNTVGCEYSFVYLT
jgi:hypothetical protein